MATPLVALLVTLALAAGLGLGFVIFGRATGGSIGGKLTISPSELDRTVATYRVGRKDVRLSAREVLEHEGLLAGAANADGSYDVPTADQVLATVRGTIVAEEAARRGIEVTDADVAAYAEATLGTSDLSALAASYGQEKDELRAQLAEAALMARLRAEVVSAEYPEAPAMPPEPGVGEEVTRTAGYAAYVIALAGSEWDAEADAWASAEGPFASALADYEIDASGASYEAALQAYWVAYQAYVAEHAEVSALWTTYVNGLLADVSVAISNLAI